MPLRSIYSWVFYSQKMIKQLHPEYTDEEVNKFHARTIYDMLYNKDKASSDGK